MKLGVTARVMGPQANAETLLACARAAEEVELEDLWVVDHIAIPPDDAEGSGGRYLDPLATLAFLSSATERIGLGTSVLVLPYRPALPTAKWIATIQELSGGRLKLGVGVGWMHAEFRALGVERAHRGRLTDEVLQLIRDCFEDDVVERNGQKFLFRPRPDRPPIYVGGQPPHAFERALAYGDGWMPMVRHPDELAAPIADLHKRARELGRPEPEVVALGGLPLDELEKARERVRAFEGIGVTHMVAGLRYEDADEFRVYADKLGELNAGLRG